MRREDFHYELPKDLIAQEPRPRGTSRMMIVEPREGPAVLRHEQFQSFPDFLSSDDVVVINDTRVIPARLFATREGAMTRPIEILLTRELEPVRWECWCKPARRVREGDTLKFSESLNARVEEKRSDGVMVLRFVVADGAEFRDEISRIGVMPLPPYIGRPSARESDRENYQTVYASKDGAIAAPTAGLHFTPEILERLGDRVVRLTLHVGIGTFKPVKADRVADHRMDGERYEISQQAAERLNSARSVVAIGTTTVRALESAHRAGGGTFRGGGGETTLFITPGFEFEAVDRMLTNFHLPESTLLMLVSAFAGVETIRHAYAEAIAQRYRFYSYGDCMFIRNRGRR